MREYETVFIIDPGCDESQVNQEVNTVKDIISAGEGKILEEQMWGKRRLAYEIKKKGEGTYAFIRFRAGSSVLQELNRRFKLNELILRHLIVVSEGAEEGELGSGFADEESPYESEDDSDS